MSFKTFNLENCFGLSLCEVLDGIACEHNLIDARFNPYKRGFGAHADKEFPWVWIDSSRFKVDRKRPPDLFDKYLRQLTGMDELGKQRHIAFLKECDERLRIMATYEELLRPLFQTLMYGRIVANGFLKTGNRAAVTTTHIDPARWMGDWIITRAGHAAVCQFYSDMSDEDPEATLTGLRLARPEGGHQLITKSMVPERSSEKQPTKKGGVKQYPEDAEHIEMIHNLISIDKIRSIKGAIEHMRDKLKIKFRGNSDLAIYQRLRSGYRNIYRNNQGGVTLGLEPEKQDYARTV